MANLQTRVDSLETNMTGLKSKISRVLELESRVTKLEAEIQEAQDMIAVIAGTPVSPPVAASYPTLLLEDFATDRESTSPPEKLWNIYYNPDQSGGFDGTNNWFATTTTAGYPYIDFRPLNYNVEAGHTRYYIKNGTWNNTYNRLSFWMKCDAATTRLAQGNTGLIQWGTYTRTEGADPVNQGAHYYHFLNPSFYADRWHKFVVNKHPQHQVGSPPGTNWGNNPTMPTFDYFYGLTRFYFEFLAGSLGTYVFDDFNFDYDDDNADDYVASVTMAYNGTGYDVTWCSLKNQSVSFTVYVSDSSMKTNGLGSGTSIGTVSTPNNDYNDCQLTSGAMSEYAGGTYFAIVPDGVGGVWSEYFLENRS